MDAVAVVGVPLVSVVAVIVAWPVTVAPDPSVKRAVSVVLPPVAISAFSGVTETEKVSGLDPSSPPQDARAYP